VDPVRQRAFAGGRELALTPVECRLLECLLRRPEHTFTRAELMAAVLKSGTTYTRTIDQHVKEVRRKLGRPDLFETGYGVGYRQGAGREGAG
jgi:DNA-binding response OmpR family regulator